MIPIVDTWERADHNDRFHVTAFYLNQSLEKGWTVHAESKNEPLPNVIRTVYYITLHTVNSRYFDASVFKQHICYEIRRWLKVETKPCLQSRISKKDDQPMLIFIVERALREGVSQNRDQVCLSSIA